MSYILEALKKSDAERKLGEEAVKDGADLNLNISVPAGPRKSWPIKIGAGFTLVVLVGLSATYVLNKKAPQNGVHRVVAVAAKPNVGPVVTPIVKPLAKAVVKSVAKPLAEPFVTPVVTPVPKPAPKPQPKPKLDPKPSQNPAPKPAVNFRPIAKPNLPPLTSANAYVDRAWGSMDDALYGQAIADLDAALTLEPTFPKAWFAHGWANEKSGNEQAAIQDYDRAIEAKPDHAFALFSRGFLHLYTGNPQAAVVDFVRTQGVATDDTLRLYSRLWLYLSRERAGQNGLLRLREDTKHEVLNIWPGPLVQFFTGNIDVKAVLKAIETTTDEHLQERRATGYFFLGIFEQLTGNNHNARSYFEKVLATGAIQYRQYDAALRELERLNR
ncbi:MAG: tetratricopeptide repeat protein [Magnetovibrio sp.]|nr:tetratricopeptide repeat protein [Magnetovibrio sp.]